MKTIILVIITVGILSSNSLAGGESSYYYIANFKDACGKETESGEHLLRQTDKCTIEVYNYYEGAEFWIEYRSIGSNNFIKFSKKHSLVKNREGYYTKRVSIPMQSTGEYRVVFDTNSNGYPDFDSRPLWLYEAETK